MGAALHSLVADVTGGEVREHEHGSLAGNRAVRGLEGANARDGSGIVLKRAIDEHFGAGGLGGGGSGYDEVSIRALARIDGAVREHGHTAREAESLCRVIALEGDIGKFFGKRVQVDSAVAIDVGLVLHAHEEHGAHGLDARSGANNLEGRAERICRGMDGAGNEAIDFAKLEHHRGKHYVVRKSDTCGFRSHAFCLAEIHESRHVLFGKLGTRFDDFDVSRELDAHGLCGGFDFFFLADEDRHGDVAFDGEAGGLHGTRFRAFREHDALDALGRLGEEACAEHGLAYAAFGSRFSKVGGEALFATEQTLGAEEFRIFAVGKNLCIEGGGEVVIILVGNDIVHARCTSNDNGIDSIKILLEEIGANLFHEHGGLARLDFFHTIGGADNFERLIDGGDEAGLGKGINNFLDFGFHLLGSRGN